MKRTFALFLFVLFTAPLTAQARTESPVRAVEGDVSVPYEKIGTLEVKMKADGGILGKSAQVLTLGLGSRGGEARRKRLKSMLAKKAAAHYGANAVVNVHYWPDPDAASFPEGFVYARGEMVRYTQFPAKS